MRRIAAPDLPAAEAARAKRRALALLVLAEVAAMAPWFSASAVVPQLSGEWGLGASQRAALTVAVQLGFVAGALASALANLPDRLSSRALFGACGLASAACTALLTLPSVGLGGALCLRFLTGAALAGVYPPGMKLAASWSKADRGRAIGLLVGALTLGSALPHLLNAVPLFGAAGMPPWRAVLRVTAAIAAAGALVVPFGVHQGPHVARSAPFAWREATRVFRSRPILLANLGYLGHMWELYAMWAWVPLYLVASYERAALPVERARLAGFATIAAGAAGSVLAGVLADRLGRTTIAIASLTISGTCCVLAGALGASPAALTALCVVWGFAVVADSAQFSAAVSELCDARYVGTALTVQTSLGFLLTALTVGLVPRGIERFGWSATLAALALGPAVGIAAMLRLRARPEARQLASGRR